MTVERKPLTAFGVLSLTSDGILLSDGTLWSQAATLGPRIYGGEPFDIDRAMVENFCRVFTSGYPQKVPVDYEHASTSSDPDIKKLRAQGQVPKAGDVMEFKGVFSADDFTGDLKAAAEQLCAKAGRTLDDPRNFGLWMRWAPTSKALQRIKDREYSELSITFYDDMPDNSTGADQGPTIVAVALTNLPFLDDMLPVAASRADHGRSPAASGSREGKPVMKTTMLTALALVVGSAVNTEEEGVEKLTALQQELPKLRDFGAVVAAELGEKDPVKAAAKIRELKAQVESATAAAAEVKKAAVKTQVEATVKQYEKALTVPLREMMVRQLTGELEAGKKLEETDTVKALKSLTSTGITEQRSSADVGTGDTNDDELLDTRAKELMRTDAEVKELRQQQGFSPAFRLALKKANDELAAKK